MCTLQPIKRCKWSFKTSPLLILFLITIVQSSYLSIGYFWRGYRAQSRVLHLLSVPTGREQVQQHHCYRKWRHLHLFFTTGKPPAQSCPPPSLCPPAPRISRLRFLTLVNRQWSNSLLSTPCLYPCLGYICCIFCSSHPTLDDFQLLVMSLVFLFVDIVLWLQALPSWLTKVT